MATALKDKPAIDSPSTWEELSEEDKKNFFDKETENPENETALKNAIEKSSLRNTITPLQIRFLHYIETIKQGTQPPPFVQQLLKQRAEQTSRHQIYAKDKNYQAIHDVVTQQESTRFANEYRNVNHKLPSPERIAAHINNVAEARFKNSHPEEANALEKEHENNAGQQDGNVIATNTHIQAFAEAIEQMQREHLSQRLQEGQISKEEFTDRSKKIYQQKQIQAAFAHVEQQAKASPIPTSHDKEHSINQVQQQMQEAPAPLPKHVETFTKKEVEALGTLHFNPTKLTPDQKETLRRLLPRHNVSEKIKEEIRKALEEKEEEIHHGHVDEETEEETTLEMKNARRPPVPVYKPKKPSSPKQVKPIIYYVPKITKTPPSPPSAPIHPYGKTGPQPLKLPPGYLGLIKTLDRLRKLAKLAMMIANSTWLTVVLIILAVILLIIIIAILIGVASNNNDAQNNNTQPIPGLTITIDGPDAVANTANQVLYNITVTYTGTDRIRVTNAIPANTVCVLASNQSTCGQAPVVWNLDDITPTQNGGTKKYALYITLKPTGKDFNLNEVVVADDLTASGANSNPVPGLTLNASAQQKVANGGSITYTIKATYTGNDQTTTIFGPIPANTSLVGNPSGLVTFPNQSTIKWLLKDNGKSPYTLTYTIQPNAQLKDTVLTNTIYATAQGTGGNASASIKRLNSADKAQFSASQWPAWSYSSCSGCAIAEVMNAYGKNLTCGDILQYEADHGYWDTSAQELGLLGWNTIANTAKNFGFNAEIGGVGQTTKTIQDIINIANSGKPVIVGLVQHILVIKGGDANNVFLVDSNTTNLTTVPITKFLNGGIVASYPAWKWDKTYAILTPQ